MTRPLLTTKLYIPPFAPDPSTGLRARLVSRLRLVERLSAGLHRKLALISAPAGFGKTTLLSECAARCGRPVAWLALDEADNDPARFLAYLIAALQGIEAGFGKGALSALQGPQAPPLASLLEGVVNELAAIPAPFVLVLDDYHLIEAEPVHSALTFLLDHQPPQMHLVISTRTDPPLPVARLRGRGQLTELRQDDLRFTLDEATQFLNEAMDLRLSTDDVAALASRTEGWIAGLQMAAVSMRDRDDPAAFVHAFTGSHRYVLDYLLEEVLLRQPARVQTFLLQTSILDRLTAPLCDAVLGEGAGPQKVNTDQRAHTTPRFGTPVSSQEIMEYLDRTNLFVVPLDEERRWYRYHHLFSDLLRQRLQQTGPDAVRMLHHRASEWYEQQGLMAAAIEHALSAEDFQRALRLIEQAAESAVMRSEIATLQGWLEALPSGMMRSHPILYVYHTWALLLSGSPVEIAEARLQDAVDADPDGSIAGEVLAVRALMATYQGKTRQGADLSRRALALLSEDRLFFRSFIAGYLGYGALYSGDLIVARQALEETVRISQRAGNLMNTVLAVSHLGDVSMLEGRLREAQAFYEQALALAVDGQGQREPIAGIALIGLGRLLVLQYDLERAEHLLVAGIDLVKRWGEAGAIGGYIGLARLRQYEGDGAGAREAIQTAERLAARFDAMQADDEYVAGQKALLWLAQGDIEVASRWIEEYGLEGDVSLHPREEGASDFEPLSRMLGYMIAARVHLAQDRPDEALQVLGPLRQTAETAGWTLFVANLLILEALALHRQGKVSEAMDPLGRALALSEPEGVVEPFIEEGARMVELLRHAASRGIAPRYASDLLARFERLSTTPPARQLPKRAPQAQPLIEPLTERELEVLRLLATRLSTPEIADRLFITVSTVRSHTKSIYAKLNVHRRSDAAERAKALQLI